MKQTTLFLSFLLAFLAANLVGQEEKPTVATEIESEFLQMENDGKTAYFLARGSVILTATNLELVCDKLEMWVKRTGDEEATIGSFGDFEKIIATGNVQITQAERIAKAGLVEMDPKEEQVILKDNPSVIQAGTTLSGLEIIIKRGKGIVIVPGSKQHKVRFVGPSIKDLGFESDKSIEEKKVEGAEPTASETTSDSNDETAPEEDDEKEELAPVEAEKEEPKQNESNKNSGRKKR